MLPTGSLSSGSSGADAPRPVIFVSMSAYRRIVTTWNLLEPVTPQCAL
jgi:hypothetical protein